MAGKQLMFSDDARHVIEGEFPVVPRTQHATPGVENHQGLGTARHLGIEVCGYRIGHLGQ